MGENTKIEWSHHTFNPWIGCAKISPGCANCYASVETFARVERGKGRELWGVNAERHITGEDNWKKPKAWDKKAAALGERHRVFCSSLADVFEDRPELEAPRRRLFKLIQATPNLDWLLLTKRPENIHKLTYKAIDPFDDPDCDFNAAGEPNGLDVADFGELYSNIWLGTTVENQEQADKRIPELLKIPAAVRFLSCEPLLSAVELPRAAMGRCYGCQSCGFQGWHQIAKPQIDWVICGGESGPNARPMQIEWARSLRDQCSAANVAFHFKQFGEHAPTSEHRDGKVFMSRVGKHAAGRILDGQTWDELPKHREAA